MLKVKFSYMKDFFVIRIAQKVRENIPFWVFPAILILIAITILTIQLVTTKSSVDRSLLQKWNPEWNKTQKKNPQETAGSVKDFSPENSSSNPPVINLQGLLKNPTGEVTSNTTAIPSRNSIFVFKVYGRAHGVGLCMDGVKYRALAGQSATEIINYYYTGVTIGHTDDSRQIRVKGKDGQIRTMTMRDYLYHLTEEPESFPAEGLKVLYIAARTYAISCIERGKHASQGFDVCASGNCCQAFDENKDLSKCPNNRAAVDATSGQILLYNGSPIVAAYCGSCGGHTENNEDVWGGKPLPYLRGKPDSYCSRSPLFSKKYEFSVAELERRLNSSPNTSIGRLEKLDLSDRTPGGRVRYALIIGSGGKKRVQGQILARLLGFASTKFEYSFR